ncbi:hypothetical protein DFQ28_004953 [Apophysomyces sp. BC1034]|nr:hypothetical protein DFQ30_004903 [Apophysomyces sp. BC1015]KAG0178148.1 hypothetical protein DFQ29_003851 [Apophysomyces sp. BC1021]KAG0188353.1 hypothetical protein DFQ28_004953 [Apophysomyces sp. BC1034]
MSGDAVQLYLYDLSQGMAKQMSLGLTGKQIDGIWHTSVVVYGQEFYYGQGIMTSHPGTTQHGQPLQRIDMGQTFLPKDIPARYLHVKGLTYDRPRQLTQIYIARPEKYHLLDFNCNTFSNELCQFLTGQSVPNHITDLPKEFLETPFGQSLLPMIENMFGQSKHGQAATTSAPPTADSVSMLQTVSSRLSAAPETVEPVQIATNLNMLDRWIQTYPTVVFFTSATCPPCRMIKPDFEQLLREKSPGKKIKALGVIVDTSVAMDAAAKYQIRATPTFMLFLNGQKFSEFRGANFAELKSSVELLLFTAYPPHPHRKINLRVLQNTPNQPILYTNVGKPDMIVAKLESFLEHPLNEQQSATLRHAQTAITAAAVDQLDVQAWQGLVDVLLDTLAIQQQFPLLDLFRSLILIKPIAEYYTNDCSQLIRVFGSITSDTHKAAWLMVLRLACNLFAHPLLASTHFTSHLPSAHRGCLTQLLVTSLLAKDNQVRQTAASLAYNCSTVVAIERLSKEQSEDIGMADQEDDDWHVELVSAIMDALIKEEDPEIVHRLLSAISKFLFLAPSDSSLPNLLSALDIQSTLNTKKPLFSATPKVLSLIRDVDQLVQQSLEK